LKERVERYFLERAGDAGVEKLLKFVGILGGCLFSINEMVQYNGLVLCLFLSFLPPGLEIVAKWGQKYLRRFLSTKISA
jgi:hypothetical protein